jgi:hypothetical protein
MVDSRRLFKSRHLDRVLKMLLRYTQVELLINDELARSLVIKYNLYTSTKQDIYINAYIAYRPVSWSWYNTYRPVSCY